MRRFEPFAKARVRRSVVEAWPSACCSLLEAGADQGGDKRCSSDRAALTAFLAVSRPDDSADSPSLYLVAPKAFGLLGSLWHMLFPYSPSEGTPPPVRQLRGMYESWLETHPGWKDFCPEDETE